MSNIKVDINAGNHSSGRGVGIYADSLIKALKNIEGVEVVKDNPDIIHFPFFDLFYPTLPQKKQKPTIVTIHDLTPLVLPKLYPKGVKGSINILRQWISLQSVSAIITDSQNSKNDIVNIFKFPSSKIFVTPLAVDDDYKKQVTQKEIDEVKKKFNLPAKFILVVPGGPNPNKNLPMLAKVTEELKIPLLIVGKGMLQEITEPIHPELKDLEALRKYSHLILPGFVSNHDLNILYKIATFYCQPSLYEGFGLPVLEAMTAGCLVVSSDSSSLPEIYPENTITFDPKNEKQMKESLQKALSLSQKEKQIIIETAKKKAKDFSWDKAAELTMAVYKKVLKK